MSKKNNTPLKISIESLKLYFSNFDKFVKYMTFPVLGQLAGLILVFTCTYFYTEFMPKLINHYPNLDNFKTLILISIIITLPGLAIFLKAFWEYLVAYGAINSMFANMLKSGRVYDFDAHTELIKRRSAKFVLLWMLIGIFSILAILPIFWVPAGVLAIFFILIFQVFTFEPELSPVGCAKKSAQLIKGHFASTFLILALSGTLTYILIPQLFDTAIRAIGINKLLIGATIPLVTMLPINEVNSILSQYNIALINVENISSIVVTTAISTILIQYTLPMRSILCCMLYKELNGGINKLPEHKSTRKPRNKKPSETLMEESHKKFSNKKLDTNILRRASEKEEE